MSTSAATDELEASDTSAQTELKRAYVHVSFGQFDQAIEACRRAAQAAPEHHLPATLQGSFEMAAGRVRDALSTLRAVTRRHPDQPLAKIYFAEACFLAGRGRQGERALTQAEALCEAEGCEAERREAEESEFQTEPILELIDELRQTWQSVESDKVPPPLVVELAGEPGG